MDAVCFDMDGVLVDSETFWHERERAELLPRAVPDASVPLAEITGMNYREIYDHLADSYEVTLDREAFLAWYEDAATDIYAEQVRLLPDALDLLADLRDQGVALALVSSSPHAWIDIVLDRFDLAFDAVVSAEDLDGPGKPAPDIYELAATALDRGPTECVAVEDSANGTRAAARAGMTVVGFGWGDGAGGDWPDADYVAESPAALRERLLALVG